MKQAISKLKKHSGFNSARVILSSKTIRIRRLTLFLAFIFIGFTTLTAQRPRKGGEMDKEKPTTEEMIQKRVDLMAEKLNLTEKQSAEIKDLMLKHQQEMQAENEAFKEQLKAHQEKLKANKESLNEGIKSTLTEEQLKTYEEFEKKLKNRARRGNNPKFNRRPGHRPERFNRRFHRRPPREPQRFHRPIPENVEE